MVFKGVDRCYNWPVAKKVGAFSLMDSSLLTNYFHSFSNYLDEGLNGCIVNIIYISGDT